MAYPFGGNLLDRYFVACDFEGKEVYYSSYNRIFLTYQMIGSPQISHTLAVL